MISEGAGGNVNLDQIDPSTIERVEIVNGASSALYGSNAIGSVINIITKKSQDKFRGGADVIYESYNTLKTRANIAARTGRFSAQASGFRNSSDGYDIEDGAYTAKYQDYGADLKLGYDISDRTQVAATGRIFTHETYNPSNSTNTIHPYAMSLAYGANATHISENKKNTIGASVNFNNYFDYNILELRDDQKVLENKIDYLTARVTDTYIANEKFEVVGGLEYNYETTYATSTLGANATSKSINDANVFAQGDWEVVKNLDLVLGARYTHNSQFGAAFTPKFAAMYELGAFKFRGSVGSAYRAPSIKELYYDFDHQGMFWVYGNADLQAEKGLHSSLSAEFTKGGVNLSVSPYLNDISNKITQYSVVDQGQTSLYYKNVSSATLKGVDFNLSARLFKVLVLNANYSYCDAKDNSTGLQLEGNTKHSGTASLTWNGEIARSPFSLMLSGRFSSPQIYGETQEDGSVLFENSKSYNIWKVALTKPFKIKSHTITFSAKVDNILEFSDDAFISPGRTYMVGIRYTFK